MEAGGVLELEMGPVPLAHDMSNGTVMLYARTLNDKNQFITPIPMIQQGHG